MTVKELGDMPAMPFDPLTMGPMCRGLTKREEFAKAAMQSLLLRGWVGDGSGSRAEPYSELSEMDSKNPADIGVETLSSDAVRVADSLLAALAKEQP